MLYNEKQGMKISLRNVEIFTLIFNHVIQRKAGHENFTQKC